jgi:hypothetical protein
MNERGQYGQRPGTETSKSFRVSPWMIGGVGLAIVGIALFGTHAVAKHPKLSAHEKEVRAWEAEFPGLPWGMDQVRDSRQLDTWERARDHWERTH